MRVFPIAEGFGYLESIPTGERLNTQGWPLFTPRQTAAMVAGFYDQQCVFLSRACLAFSC